MLSFIKQLFTVSSFTKHEDRPALTVFEVRQTVMINEFVQCMRQISALSCSSVIRDMVKPYGKAMYTLEDSFSYSLNLDLFFQQDMRLTVVEQMEAHLQLRKLTSKIRKLGTALASNTENRYALVDRLFQEMFYADPYAEVTASSTFDNRLAVYDEHVYLTIAYSTFSTNNKSASRKKKFS